MRVVKTVDEMQQASRECRMTGRKIAFVPTMGALHLGHFSLIKTSIKSSTITIVSIFVNKLQFGPNEDFNNYPRTLEKDLNALKNMKVDAVFLPSHEELYDKSYSFNVSENNLSTNLEGAARPNFFNGVCTVVLKLFNIIRPTQSFFGQKDIQQLMIVKKMALDLNLNVKIVGCKTIRNSHGLAMSSRNQYLTNEEKLLAANIYLAFNQKPQELIGISAFAASWIRLPIQFILIGLAYWHSKDN